MSLEDMTQAERDVHALGLLARKLANDPQVGSQVKRLLMKGDPRLQFKEIEIEDQVAKIKEESTQAAIKVREELLQLRAEQEQARLHAKVEESGLPLKDVLELMVAHGLSPIEKNYDMAIEVLISRQNTLAESTPDSLPVPTEADKVSEAEKWKDPSSWRIREAHRVLNEMLPMRRRVAVA